MSSTPQSADSPASAATARIPGLALGLGLAAVSTVLGTRFPLVGGPVFGLSLGLLVQATGRIGPVFNPGVTYGAKRVLQYAIILLGAGLSLDQIITTGASSLAVMLSTLAACLVAAWGLGQVLRIPGNLTTLIGVGTAICGASAIAAVSPVVEAEEREVAYAVSAVFAFNICAVVLFPPLGHLLGLSAHAFGLWAGTAVNDTSSVVAVAYAYGQEAGVYATVVKLTRSTLIIPIALILAAFRAGRPRPAHGSGAPMQVRRLIPWFIVWFLVAALLHTLGVLPDTAIRGATAAGRFLIVVALAAVGLSADFRQMVQTGPRPILFGFLLWLTVSGTSLVVQGLTGQL